MSPSLSKVAIACFCMYHMFSVALYSMPEVLKKEPFIQMLKYHFDDSIVPYMWSTSQWQSWPLFAPDPLRRVTNTYIETYDGTLWKKVEATSNTDLSWWRKSKEIKGVSRIHLPGREEMLQRYIELQCEKFNIIEETPIRLQYRYYVIPKNSIQHSANWWKNWKPDWKTKTSALSTCPYVTRS